MTINDYGVRLKVSVLSIAPILSGLGRSKRRDFRELRDEECAERSGAGDNDAFAELVRRYQNRVFRYLKRMVGSEEEARDLTQETFLRVYKALPKWNEQALFRSWLFRIASNAAIDELRRRQDHRPLSLNGLDEPVSQQPTVEHIHYAEERYLFLEKALIRISEIYRQPLLLRELEGMTYSEIGKLLDLTEGTVKSRIARARAKLCELFRNCGYC